MAPQDYLAAVEAGFRSHASGHIEPVMPMHIPAGLGIFHAKAARLVLEREYVALKLNGNFPGNPRLNGLPTIQGVVILCDASHGSVLAVMDSIEITLRRTAAASALAARLLARRAAESLCVCGCGEQGRAQLLALAGVLPLRQVFAWDLDTSKAHTFAREMRISLKIDVDVVQNLGEAARSSDVIVTATTARTSFLMADMVSPGTLVAAVGADSPEKSEIAPELMAKATIVVDLLAQAAAMGDLHHAIDAGMVAIADVHAELGDIVAGRKPSRSRDDEIIVFDSTGTAIQDVASAAWIYQRAIAGDLGLPVRLGAVST
jgi:ornithine cyclodeaminase/alanine dehydrogenase-like protein (mu-crystallin family)